MQEETKAVIDAGKYPKTSKIESDNTSFNTDIDLSTKPQRGDYGPGKKRL
jgi:hypothetical protein